MEDILLEACEDGDKKRVMLLLEEGADLNKPDGYGWTALYMSCRFARMEVIRLLLEQGADIHCLTARQESICHAACNSKSADTFSLVLSLGADVMQADAEGFTPLSLAITRKRRSLLDILRPHVLQNRIFTHPHTDSFPNLNLFGRDKVGSASFLLYGIRHPLSKWEVSEYMDIRGCVRNGVRGFAKAYWMEVEESEERVGGMKINFSLSSAIRLTVESQRVALFWLSN